MYSTNRFKDCLPLLHFSYISLDTTKGVSSFHKYGIPSTSLGVLVAITILIIPVYADPIVKTTSGGTINVGFVTDPVAPNPGDQTQIKLNFINKQSNSLQQHIDYKISVMQGSNQVFGIPVTHTAVGAVSIPFQFQTADTYQVIVEIDGILFQPIPPETATFTLNIGNSGAPSNGTSAGTIKIPTWVRNNAKYWSAGSIDDGTFAQGIQYMIKQKIIIIPPTSSGQPSSTITIPQWVKTNAGYWSKGQIDDPTFVMGIQYLIQHGIIHV